MQAVLILAHKNINQVAKLAKILSERFLVYIHIDKKVKLTEQDVKNLIIDNVQYFQAVSVKWGGWSISAATILLMRKALENTSIKYIHIISGQDWPVRPINEIYDFYNGNNNIYLLSKLASETKKSGEPIILWQKYYFHYDHINRKTTWGKIYHRLSIIWQTLIRVDKLKALNVKLDIYQGPNWMDMPREVVIYLLNYIDKHPNVIKVFETGYCPDEFWVQTILCNNEEYKERIVQNYHRYIVWEKKYNSYPAILDEKDYNYIINGDYHFARKIDEKMSEKLLKKMNWSIDC